MKEDVTSRSVLIETEPTKLRTLKKNQEHWKENYVRETWRCTNEDLKDIEDKSEQLSCFLFF